MCIGADRVATAVGESIGDRRGSEFDRMTCGGRAIDASGNDATDSKGCVVRVAAICRAFPIQPRITATLARKRTTSSGHACKPNDTKPSNFNMTVAD